MHENAPTVVFVHGLLGFAELPLAWPRIAYFRRVAAEISVGAQRVLFPAVPPVGTVVERAAALAAFLQRLPDGPLVLVAHSMGGLDCRYLIHHHDPRGRVRALATVGTPHRGTSLARWMLEGDGMVPWLARRWVARALADMTPEACEALNRALPNRPEVRYLSYAGCRTELEMPLWLRPWERLILSGEGDNDGLVPVASARWGQFRGTVRADHFELVGWSLARPNLQTQRPFDHLGLYRNILDALLTPEPGWRLGTTHD